MRNYRSNNITTSIKQALREKHQRRAKNKGSGAEKVVANDEVWDLEMRVPPTGSAWIIFWENTTDGQVHVPVLASSTCTVRVLVGFLLHVHVPT